MSSATERRAELLRELMTQMRKSSAISVLHSQTVADRVGLNPSDMEALDLLLINGPVTAGRLAELTGLTTGAITGIVDRLERVGHVRREEDPTDRRRVIVRAVPERAEREIAPLYAPMAGEMSALLDRYSEAELATILDFFGSSYDIVSNHISRLRSSRPAGRRARNGE